MRLEYVRLLSANTGGVYQWALLYPPSQAPTARRLKNIEGSLSSFFASERLRAYVASAYAPPPSAAPLLLFLASLKPRDATLTRDLRSSASPPHPPLDLTGAGGGRRAANWQRKTGVRSMNGSEEEEETPKRR